MLINWFNEDRVTSTLTVFDIESGIYKPIRSTPWQIAAKFYSDPRFVLVCTTQNIFKLDTETGETQALYTETQDILSTSGNSIDIAHDDSWICFTKSEAEADIWMIEFEEE